MNRNKEPIASKIDHTLLKPDVAPEEIVQLCQEAIEYQFASVCINPCYVALASKLLKDSGVKPITVVGFPSGNSTSSTKTFEARQAIQDGAKEIDMVIHLDALKNKEYSQVFEDIQQVVEASRPFIVKVIIEASNLNDDQKIIACALSKAAGASFVKTSTGFGAGGATVDDIRLIRRIVGDEMGIKASGGIRTYEDALKFITAGANRIGASSGVNIVKESKKQVPTQTKTDSSNSY